MSILNNIAQNIERASQGGAQMALNLKDNAKFTLMIREEEKTLREHTLQLGRDYYAKYGESPHEDLQALCGKIKDSLEKIEAVKAEQEKLKYSKTCPLCGNKNKDDAVFCVSCGQRLNFDQGIKCLNCGEANQNDARFCSGCGAVLESASRKPAETVEVLEAACPACGEPLTEDAKFCTNCGQVL